MSGDDPSAGESDSEIFYFLKETLSWIDQVKEEHRPFMIGFFSRCTNRIRQRRHRPFKIDDLPQQEVIKFRTVSVAQVVRFQNPWDMHLIFEDNIIDGWAQGCKELAECLVQNSDFSKDFFTFKCPLDMYHGFSMMLTHYVIFLLENCPSLTKVPYKYKPGDLVITTVSRDKDKEDNSLLLAYRGVVIENVDIIGTDLNLTKGAVIVFLLDTGEKRIVTENFLYTLPRPFALCPPLAVKGALHGVSPIGPEWSAEACRETEALVNPDNIETLFAECFTNRKPHSSTDPSNLLQSLTNMEPYFMELRTVANTNNWEEAVDAVNVTTHLCNQLLGLEWSLIPQRKYFREQKRATKQEAKEMKQSKGNPDEKRNFHGIGREEILYLCEGHPQPLKTMTDDQRNLELHRLFHLREDLEQQIISGVDNVVSLKLSDPGGVLKEESVPFIFKVDDGRALCEPFFSANIL